VVVKTTYSTLISNRAMEGMTELMTKTINTKVSNVMNVKGMDILELNVLLTSRNRRRE
jgi:hypothetical protein